ncbi:MAG: TonB family protein [Terriglobales bacterium]
MAIGEPTETVQETGRPAPGFDVESLFLELRDQKERNRRREAVFLSVIVHLCIFILILLHPKLPSWLESSPRTALRSPQQVLQHQHIVYLETPLKTPKPRQKVRSNVLSDRDRLLHRHQPVLESYSAPSSPPPRAALRAPVPARPAAPPPQPAQPKREAQAAGHAADQGRQAANLGLQLEPVPPQVTQPRLTVPIPGLSASSQLRRAIDEAARQRVQGRQSIAEVGQLPVPAGNPGPGGRGEIGNGVQILTDTQGVDFKPYLQRVLDEVRKNWYAVMPEMAYLGRKGRVVVVFAIQQNGSVPGLLLESPSGTFSFDQAAQASINASNPFPPLPSEFHGPQLRLRFYFFYNINPYQSEAGGTQ